MQPRYVRIDDRRDIDSGRRTGGCAACGWFGALGGPHHNTAECLACGTVQCEGLHSTCRVCFYGLFKRMSGTSDRPCGYKNCPHPAVVEAPRVRRVCREHMSRAKVLGPVPMGQSNPSMETLADHVFRAMTVERSRAWVLFSSEQ